MSLNSRTRFLKLLASGEIDKLLDGLNEYWTQAEDADKVNQVILIISRLSELKRANRLQTIGREQYVTELTQIKDAVSELIQFIPEDTRPHPSAKRMTPRWIWGAGLIFMGGLCYFIIKYVRPAEANDNIIPPVIVNRTGKDSVQTNKDTQPVTPRVKPSLRAMIFSGYVSDATRKTPIAGAKIQFSGITLTTGNDGYFKSGDLRSALRDASFLQATITAPGYHPRTENVYTTDLDNKQFYLEPDEKTKH